MQALAMGGPLASPGRRAGLRLEAPRGAALGRRNGRQRVPLNRVAPSALLGSGLADGVAAAGLVASALPLSIAVDAALDARQLRVQKLTNAPTE